MSESCKIKVMNREYRALLVESFLRGHLSELELKAGMQLYIIAMKLESMK